MKLGLVSVPTRVSTRGLRLRGRSSLGPCVVSETPGCGREPCTSSAPASPRSLPRPGRDREDSHGAARSARIYGCAPGGSLRQTGQQAPSILMGAGQPAGWQASTKQVICPSWRETEPDRSVPGTTLSITPASPHVPACARV